MMRVQTEQKEGAKNINLGGDRTSPFQVDSFITFTIAKKRNYQKG